MSARGTANFDIHPETVRRLAGSSGMENSVIEPVNKLRPLRAATFLGLSPSTLAKMRLRGDGPPFAKLGTRAVLYALRDLEKWVEARKRLSTSAQAAMR